MTPVQKLIGLGLAILLALAIGFVGAWQVQDWRYGKQLAEIGKAQALAITEAGNTARQEEQRRQASVNKVASHAREQNKAAAVDAGVADAAGDRLHIEANQFATTACGDPGAAQRGASATRAAMVLSDLLSRSVATNRELAQAYDRAKIAGKMCESTYEALHGRHVIRK